MILGGLFLWLPHFVQVKEHPSSYLQSEMVWSGNGKMRGATYVGLQYAL